MDHRAKYKTFQRKRRRKYLLPQIMKIVIRYDIKAMIHKIKKILS